MTEFTHGPIRLHYEVHGQGRPVVLLHGGTVSFKHNYADFGWIQAFNAAGFQVIGLDLRGHGKSAKPHEAEAYGIENLASDVIALLDHLKLQSSCIVGYSLGTVITLHLLKNHAHRVERAALVATGDGLIGHPPHTFALLLPALAEVLRRTEYPRDLPKHLAAYWNFVVATQGDALALSALSQANYPHLPPEQAASIVVPTQVVSGQHDKVLGRGEKLAAALGRGEYLEIAGADHFSLAADADTRGAVIDFLSR